MFKDFFKFSDLLDVPVYVMLFFFVMFAIVLVRVFAKHRKPHYDAMSRLPLDNADSYTIDSQEVSR